MASHLAEGLGRVSGLRILVFGVAFALAAAISLIFVYSQPAQYRSSARLQVLPAGGVEEATSINSASPALTQDPASFLYEVQVLTSRPVLQDAAQRLRTDGALPDIKGEPADSMQRMLRANVAEGSNVIQLSAEGGDSDFVSRVVNAVAEAYRTRVADSYKSDATQTYSDADDEVATLQKQIDEKRAALDDLRQRYDIVSLERDENSVLANIAGLTQTYTRTNEELAKAQGHLEAVRGSASRGETVVLAKDDPTLAALERRIAELREEIGDLERRFTPQYLALDANVKANRARIADLEQQLKARRASSQSAAMTEAQEQVTASRAAVSRLRRDLDENQSKARSFAARLAQFKAQQEDLEHLQSMQRAVTDRLAKLRASERSRAPRVQIIEAAVPSLIPFSPNYERNALISIAGSLLFGIFAVWLVEFLRGPAPARATMVHHTLAPGLPQPSHDSLDRLPPPPPRSLNTVDLLQLPSREIFPRELDNAEIAALMANGTDDVRFATVALLMGLSVPEIIALRWVDIDLAAGTLAAQGEAARIIPAREPLTSLLRQRAGETLLRQGGGKTAAATVLHDGRGGSLSGEEIERLVLYAAYDAGLDRPQEINSAALRHTYLAFLLRQGIRASDISRVAGHIPQDAMVNYMQIGASRTRQPLNQVNCIHPALQDGVQPVTAS